MKLRHLSQPREHRRTNGLTSNNHWQVMRWAVENYVSGEHSINSSSCSISITTSTNIGSSDNSSSSSGSSTISINSSGGSSSSGGVSNPEL